MTGLIPSPGRKERHGLLFAGFLGFALVIFASHLRDGYLSDDFQYVLWARRSVVTLLAHLTTASYPQVLRPLPAFAWLFSRLAAGPLWLHLLALAIHGANSALICGIARKWGAPRSIAILLGFLFLAFPLSGETVLWLSSGFDLWATCLALLTVAALQEEKGIGLGLLFYTLALFCKESALCLPLALLLLFPRLRWRSLPFFATAGLYLAARLVLFGGLGGYRDSLGRTVATQLHPIAFLHSLILQLPARILAPLPVESRLALGGMIAISLILLLGLASAFRPLKAPLVAVAVFVAAILPAAPLLRVEWDLQGARLLYLPLALALAALARFTRPVPRIAHLAGAFLAVYWLIAAILNGLHWSAASHKAIQTLDAMNALQSRVPAGSTVLVDALDTYQGAYVFRNGLPEAAELAGLRRDLQWKRGTVALLGASADADLGSRLFEIGVDEKGSPVDWTACDRSLFASPEPGVSLSLIPASTQTWLSTPIQIPPGCHAITLATACGKATGTLFWKTSERASFTTMRSREFRLSGEPLPIRLGRLDAPSRLWVRIDTDRRMDPRCLGGG